MKKLTKGALILVAMLFVCSCLLDRGPIAVDASYPGDFLVVVNVARAHRIDSYRTNASMTYHFECDGGRDLSAVNSSAQKVDDLGTLEIRISGNFGEVSVSAPLGDTEPIYVIKRF